MKYHKYILLTSLFTIGLLANLNAQMSPLSMQYFNYRYIGNPAHAGSTQELNAAINYRKQWTSFPGSPQIMNFALDYGVDQYGLGMNITIDKAGLQNNIRALASYAYHIPLDYDSQTLSFGLSVGVTKQQLNTADVVGSINDALVNNYNHRGIYLDGDIGAVYQNQGFSVEVALPNLNNMLKRDKLNVTDVSTFYTAASYKLPIYGYYEEVIFEPRVIYRGVKGFKSIVDFGGKLSIENYNMMVMLHSNTSLSLGTGVDLKDSFNLGVAYNSQFSRLNTYTNGTFELNLKIKL